MLETPSRTLSQAELYLGDAKRLESSLAGVRATVLEIGMLARSIRYVAVLCLVAAGAIAIPAQAVEANRDYYTASTNREAVQTLKNVEFYHLGLAENEMKAKRYPNAFGDLEFILRYFPNHPQALSMIAELCDVKWKRQECDAQGWMERAIAINPAISQTWLIYGIHLQYLGRVPEAIDSYKKAIQINPSSANAHYNLGLAYFDNKQPELANQHAQFAALLGFQLPGLRDKLTRAGQWKPLDPEELRRQMDASYGKGATARNAP